MVVVAVHQVAPVVGAVVAAVQAADMVDQVDPDARVIQAGPAATAAWAVMAECDDVIQ